MLSISMLHGGNRQFFNIYMEDSHGQFVHHRNDASNGIGRGVPNDRK